MERLPGQGEKESDIEIFFSGGREGFQDTQVNWRVGLGCAQCVHPPKASFSPLPQHHGNGSG